MIIRKYRDIPASYVPDEHEVVEARQSGAGDYAKAVILRVQRMRNRRLKIKLQWWDTGEVAWVETNADDWPSMIRQITKSQPPQ